VIVFIGCWVLFLFLITMAAIEIPSDLKQEKR
jgi:hypothetical protein